MHQAPISLCEIWYSVKIFQIFMPKTKKAKKVPAKRKIVKKLVAKKIGKPVGKVTHYFSDISVGVIKLSAPLSLGDEIRIMGGENTDFNQKVNSMQADHKEIKKAKKGNSIGIKVKERVREGYKMYKV